MKPPWDEAPKWANYLSMESSGEWYWFEFKPVRSKHRVWHLDKGCPLHAGPVYGWESTLEERPK